MYHEYDAEILLNKVKQVTIHHQYHWKPIWKTLEFLKPEEALKWVDRWAPYESIASEWACAQVYNKMSQFIVPRRAEFLRTLAAEIQNLIWHFNYIKEIFKAAEDEIYVENSLYLREMLFDVQEIWTGSRILPQFFTLGGVERDLTVGVKNKVSAILYEVKKDYASLLSQVEVDYKFLRLLAGVLPLSKNFVSTWNLNGIIGKASGFDQDLRHLQPYGAYEVVKIRPYITPTTKITEHIPGDALSRFYAALFEIRESMTICENLLHYLPAGDFNVDKHDIFLPQNTLVHAKVQAPSGAMYAMFVDGKISLSSASSRLAPVLESVFKDKDAESLTIAYASMGYDVSQGALV